MSVQWKVLVEATRVTPGSTVDLAKDFDPGRHDEQLGKDAGTAALAQAEAALLDLQDRFFAQADRSLLIVLQGIDTAGKDGTIKHVMSGLNPEGVDVHSFKAPSATERAHDYLWRHQTALPALGRIAVFNRSHYENVLITRVHPELLWPRTAVLDSDDIWQRRYRDINDWERYLTDNGIIIVKLFLNLSKGEQERRFLARIDEPEKNWKFSRRRSAGARVLGRLPGGIPGHAQPHQHRLGALACDPRRSQMVQPLVDLCGAVGDPAGSQPALSAGRRRRQSRTGGSKEGAAGHGRRCGRTVIVTDADRQAPDIEWAAPHSPTDTN